MIIARGQNSIAHFKHDGGNMTVDGDFYCSYASNSVATVEKNGGDWTLGKSLYLGWGGKNVNSSALTTFYHNGGKMNVASNLDITYYGSCDFHMNGGEITVGNQVRFGTWYLKNGWHHGTVNLNGGILSAKGFYLNNSDNKKLSKVVFDGGTFKATASGYIVSGAPARYEITNDTMLDALRARVGIDVGPKGGTIDTAGYNITNVVNFTRTSGSGGMRFVGGGSVVLTGTIGYTGKTFVEVGTRLELTDSSAKNAILNTYGLDIVGFAASGDYTVFTYEGGLDAEADLEKVTCSFAPDSTFEVVGNSIVCHYVKPVGNFWTGAKDNNLSDAANWSDGVVPIDNAFLSLVKPAVLTVGDTFAPATLTIDGGSAVVTIGAGDLHISGSLTNACKLAIAQGASLTVDGNLVVGDGQGTFLYSNEGTVTVTGNAVCANTTTATTTKQYEVVTANTRPIKVGGFLFDRTGSRVYYRLESHSTGSGLWVVGKNGFQFLNPQGEGQTRFYAQNSPVTLYSSANWTLANTGKKNTSNGDLQVYDSSSLTIDTTDYTDKTTPRTVTLEGRIKAEGNVTITGCGNVVVATTVQPGGSAITDTTIASGKTIAVTDTATLQVNAGKKILGAGTISLSSGTTLALASISRGFATPDIVPVMLPDEGAATIRIDGKRLVSGKHVLCTLASVPENLADHVTVTGEALDGRRYKVKVVEETENEKTIHKLVIDIYPDGLRVIVR